MNTYLTSESNFSGGASTGTGTMSFWLKQHESPTSTHFRDFEGKLANVYGDLALIVTKFASEVLLPSNPIENFAAVSAAFYAKILPSVTSLNSRSYLRLSDIFVYRGFWEIKDYLLANPQIRELLFETYYQLENYFVHDEIFVLELVPDFYEPSFEQLFIKVLHKSDFGQSLDTLEKFQREWWFERTGYLLNSPVITVE